MLIDCESCRVRGVGCTDCVISLFLDQTESVELTTDEAQALQVLAHGGLAPPLRLVPAPADGRAADIRSGDIRSGDIRRGKRGDVAAAG
jgi:hypothetical protein